MNAETSARRSAFPAEILAQLDEFCCQRRTGKIEIDILLGQVMVVKGTETFFDSKRSVDKTKRAV